MKHHLTAIINREGHGYAALRPELGHLKGETHSK